MAHNAITLALNYHSHGNHRPKRAKKKIMSFEIVRYIDVIEEISNIFCSFSGSMCTSIYTCTIVLNIYRIECACFWFKSRIQCLWLCRFRHFQITPHSLIRFGWVCEYKYTHARTKITMIPFIVSFLFALCSQNLCYVT